MCVTDRSASRSGLVTRCHCVCLSYCACTKHARSCKERHVLCSLLCQMQRSRHHPSAGGGDNSTAAHLWGLPGCVRRACRTCRGSESPRRPATREHCYQHRHIDSAGLKARHTAASLLFMPWQRIILASCRCARCCQSEPPILHRTLQLVFARACVSTPTIYAVPCKVHINAGAPSSASPFPRAPCARPPSRCCRQSRRHPRPRPPSARTPRPPPARHCSHRTLPRQRLPASICGPHAPSHRRRPQAHRSGPPAPLPMPLRAALAQPLCLQGQV